jgi:hypothetical protein
MSKFDHNKWIKDFKSGKFLNEARKPKSWNSQFAMNAIEAYEAGDIDINDPNSVKKWDKEYNGGVTPRPAFETAEIIAYAIEMGLKPDGSELKDMGPVTEAEFGVEDEYSMSTRLTEYMEEVERVLETIQDLEQQVAGGIEMYADETGDYRFDQLRNQSARYIQSAEKNMEGLLKALDRAGRSNA